MPTLVLRFPGGRYHATPTGHHVNEGLVEWPPSPWRLVRALIACGYTTQQWTEVPATGRRLIDALCSTLPEYRLPSAALGHSRHYMPTTVLEKGREKTTLVLDTFADVGDGDLWVRWPTRIDDEAQVLFATLADHLGYLGRSESWVLAKSVADDVMMPADGRSFHHTDGCRPGPNYEQIAIVAPEIPSAYAHWRESEVAGALASFTSGTTGRSPTKAQQAKQKKKVEDTYPVDLLTCLQLDTSWWKERRWSQAPGSRRVIYWREANALEVGPQAEPRRVAPAPIEVLLFALSTPSGSRSALPTVTRTLPQAELLHRAIISKVGSVADGGAPELTGRDEMGRPLQGHRHAHILPLDLDDDGHLDHVVVYASMGLGPVAQHALRSVKRTYAKGGVGEIQVAIAGRGALADLRSLGGSLDVSVARLLGPPAGATRWRSATPFVPPRHLKKRGQNTLEGQVQAELQSRGLPPACIEVLPWVSDLYRLRHVVRRRRSPAPQPPADAAFMLRLQFERPVHGPLCIGYASHFGLGRFAAEQE